MRRASHVTASYSVQLSGLHDAALDLVHDAVRVHGVAAVHGARDTAHPDRARLALDLDLHRDRAVGGEVLVAREGEAAPMPALAPGSSTIRNAPPPS